MFELNLANFFDFFFSRCRPFVFFLRRRTEFSLAFTPFHFFRDATAKLASFEIYFFFDFTLSAGWLAERSAATATATATATDNERLGFFFSLEKKINNLICCCCGRHRNNIDGVNAMSDAGTRKRVDQLGCRRLVDDDGAHDVENRHSRCG